MTGRGGPREGAGRPQGTGTAPQRAGYRPPLSRERYDAVKAYADQRGIPVAQAVDVLLERGLETER